MLPMSFHALTFNRREFLKRSSILGLGSLSALASERAISAASKNRVVVFQGVGLDSLHPYAYSGGGISGIWQHVIEPLIEMDFSRNEYIGVLAESWSIKAKGGFFICAKKFAFTAARR
jgi:ABC-type oligopeptide transport system substrate-binding subunit